MICFTRIKHLIHNRAAVRKMVGNLVERIDSEIVEIDIQCSADSMLLGEFVLHIDSTCGRSSACVLNLGMPLAGSVGLMLLVHSKRNVFAASVIVQKPAKHTAIINVRIGIPCDMIFSSVFHLNREIENHITHGLCRCFKNTARIVARNGRLNVVCSYLTAKAVFFKNQILSVAFFKGSFFERTGQSIKTRLERRPLRSKSRCVFGIIIHIVAVRILPTQERIARCIYFRNGCADLDKFFGDHRIFHEAGAFIIGTNIIDVAYAFGKIVVKGNGFARCIIQAKVIDVKVFAGINRSSSVAEEVAVEAISPTAVSVALLAVFNDAERTAGTVGCPTVKHILAERFDRVFIAVSVYIHQAVDACTGVIARYVEIHNKRIEAQLGHFCLRLEHGAGIVACRRNL